MTSWDDDHKLNFLRILLAEPDRKFTLSEIVNLLPPRILRKKATVQSDIDDKMKKDRAERIKVVQQAGSITLWYRGKNVGQTKEQIRAMCESYPVPLTCSSERQLSDRTKNQPKCDDKNRMYHTQFTLEETEVWYVQCNQHTADYLQEHSPIEQQRLLEKQEQEQQRLAKRPIARLKRWMRWCRNHKLWSSMGSICCSLIATAIWQYLIK